jgi:ribosomal protein S21
MQVELQHRESFESLLRRFKKVVKRSGILIEVADRRKFGGKPSTRKRFKKTRAVAQAKERAKASAFFEKRGSRLK